MWCQCDHQVPLKGIAGEDRQDDGDDNRHASRSLCHSRHRLQGHHGPNDCSKWNDGIQVAIYNMTAHTNFLFLLLQNVYMQCLHIAQLVFNF